MPDLPDDSPAAPGSPRCDRAGPERTPTPAELRSLALLRALVVTLTATMIAGIVALVALLYTRLPGGATPPAPPVPALPGAISLPEGAVPQAVTAGQGWWAVVTTKGEILLYDGQGTLLRRILAEELAAD